MGKRVEKDSLGEKELPVNAYYGIQTERGRENFEISGLALNRYPDFIYGIAAIKKAAALANFKVNALDVDVCSAICNGAEDVMQGKMDGEFPIDIFQGGGGTSANMNVNEVIANRANELITGMKGYGTVHPNTHVNMGQSTNDVIPAAMKIACYTYLGKLAGSAQYLEEALLAKEKEFANVVKLGRTCIQDALPITFGQEFSGYCELIRRRKNEILRLREKCRKLPMGATAVGTKMSVRAGYIEQFYVELEDILGYEVRKDENFFDGLQNADIYVDISAGIKALACGISKIATDLRMMSSGPDAGIGELTLPAVQPGSSIMPGKVNPVMPELMNQICYQICGNDVVITMACEGGELDLNVWEPVIMKSVEESAKLLINGIPLFVDKCVKGIKVNKEISRAYSERSIALSTVIATLFDYPTGSRIAKFAMEKGISIKDACMKEKILTKEEADIFLDPMLLTDGEVFAEKIEEFRSNRRQK